jgi:hypothetical protein
MRANAAETAQRLLRGFAHEAPRWLESINSLVQAAKAKARGYRSLRNLVPITYLIAGKIDIRPHLK